MIRPSPELLAVAHRWFEAMRSQDDSVLQDLFSENAAATYLGTSEGELWKGAQIRGALGDHFRQAPAITRMETKFEEAFEAGKIGWSLHLRRYWIEGRTEPTDFRFTFVWALEGAHWQIVQRHNSVTAANQDIVGADMPLLNELIEAARTGAQLEQTEGMASVMFTDIVGSTALAGALGDSRWAEIVAAHFSDLCGIVEDHGGQFVKSLGDGTMSSFPSARRALEAAEAIRGSLAAATSEPRLSVRIGLHTGDVIQTQADFFGTVVNKAARIAALAGPGEILLSDATLLIAGLHNLEVEGPRQVGLAGLGEGHVIYALSPPAPS